MLDIGDRIKLVRKMYSDSPNQYNYAKIIGITRDQLTNYEQGRVKPPRVVINQISTTCNVNPDWLETGEGEMLLTQSDSDIELITRAMEGQSESKKRLIRIIAGMPDALLDNMLECLEQLTKK